MNKTTDTNFIGTLHLLANIKSMIKIKTSIAIKLDQTGTWIVSSLTGMRRKGCGVLRDNERDSSGRLKPKKPTIPYP